MSCDFDNEKIVLEPNTGIYFSISATGKRIWEMLAKPMPVTAIIDTLLTEFEVDRITCENETLEFLKSLLDAKLLEQLESVQEIKR